MKTAKDLRFSDSAGKADKLLKKLRKGKAPEGIFAVCLSSEQNRLEILPSVLLKQPYYQKKPGVVLGYALTKEEAEEMAAEMLTEAYRKDALKDLSACFTAEDPA